MNPARRGTIGRELIGRGVDNGGRRHELRSHNSWDGSCVGYLELGRGGRRLGLFRRCGAEYLRMRVLTGLPLVTRGLTALASRNTLLHSMTVHRLLHGADYPLGGLEPAFAAALGTIDPVLAVSRQLTGLRQALLPSGSGRSDFFRSGAEQVSNRIRGCRQRRETCENESREARSEITGHGNPWCFAPADSTTFGCDLGRKATQIWQRSGFIWAPEPRLAPVSTEGSQCGAML